MKNLYKHAERVVSHSTFRIFVFIVFILQTSFLAIAVNRRVPPDEGNQIDFIKYYAHHSVSPFLHDQMPTVNLGDITREVDFVYHYVMSFVMRALPFGDHVDLHIIRFFSIAFAVLTFILLLKILRDLHVSKAASNLGLLVFTNIPMVLMMSSAVNADVLVWLGTVAGIYFIMRLWKRHQPVDLLMLLIVAIYGGIVKRTLFPICLVFGVVALVMLVKYWHDIREKVSIKNWRQVILVFVLVAGIGLFAERVGGNIIMYHKIAPSCMEVQGDARCSVFWLHDRRVALQNNPQDAIDVYLGEGASIDQPLKPPIVFTSIWAVSSFDNIVDIQTQGWHHEVTPPWWLGTALLLFTLATIIWGITYESRRFKRDEHARWRLVVIGFALLTIASQLIVNYGTYERSHVFGLALNGRYILPALILLVGLSVWYGAKMFGKIAGPVLIVLTIVAVIGCSGLIMMVRNPQLFTG